MSPSGAQYDGNEENKESWDKEKDDKKEEPKAKDPRLNAYYFKEKVKAYNYGGGYGNISSRVDENKEKDLEFEIYWNYHLVEEKPLEKALNKCSQ